jgi:molybdopterin-containing oxidoreductase family iron-sulfur binding subunit
MSSLNDLIDAELKNVIPIRPEAEAPRLNLPAIREKLAASNGRDYWRSLEEVADTEEFQDYVKHEFPRDVELWLAPMTRRSFLQLMGAGLALAFFSGCRKPLQEIVPFMKAPEDVIPGRPLFYASALPFNGYARGVLVENHTGRPTKIEGNPEHPDSLGAADLFMQAATLGFYDPDRSQTISYRGANQTWDNFVAALKKAADAQRLKKGAGLRILTETVTSPSFADQIQRLSRQFPRAKWHQFEPVHRDNIRAGAHHAFGKAVETRYRFSEADVIVSLDADFLVGRPGSLRYMRDFSDARRVDGKRNTMNRLYMVETCPSVTGSMADHRWPLRANEIPRFAHLLAREVGLPLSAPTNDNAAWRPWVRAIARDLRAHRGRGVVLAGDTQPPEVHALAHALNDRLGNAGRTVVYTEPVEARPQSQRASLKELTSDMNSGAVDALLIVGGNPVYNAPADLAFAEALKKVDTKIHLGLYDDETSAACDWHVPEAHALESWGDLRAFDGTVSFVQPQIEPLYGGKTGSELISALLDDAPRSAHEIMTDYWKRKSRTVNFDGFWKKTLHDGVMAGSAFPALFVAVRAGFWKELTPFPADDGSDLEIVLRPDPTIGDGRHANNGWLQEVPKAITKLTWDNAALMSAALAERLGVANEDVVELTLDGRSVKAPVWIVPGHADQSITLHLGYGRTRAGRVGNGAGVNAYRLQNSSMNGSQSGLKVTRAGGAYKLSGTQHHAVMEGKDFVRVATLAEYAANPAFARDGKAPDEKTTLYQNGLAATSDEYAWGMAIDLNACNGCNACIVACQAENNIPIVGKEQVAKGREMHWLRVDRYFTPELENPESYSQPVPCMHCEDAPCEPVCPVGATVHSDEGLNEMVYNRCVGTRYCSNNCPYKVRHFNFLAYTAPVKGPLKLLQNPDVTVRSRGVMEKCTYCVQRIQGAKIEAGKENRPVRDGEIVSACAQTCPAQAIVFGNIKDPNSRVSQLKAQQRDYALLAELGTRPRTTYQAKLKNPNPELA